MSRVNKLLAIQAFVSVAEAGNFSLGGRRLSMSPSSMTKLIAQLEADLDARLLNRSTRSFSLTDQGRAYYEKCLSVLSALEESELALRSAAYELKGRLRIVVPFSFARVTLVPALADFMVRYPHLNLELDMSDRPVDLVEGGYDLCVRTGEQKDSGLVARLLMKTPQVVVASPAYLARHGTPAKPEDLVHQNCIVNRDGPEWVFHQESGAEHRVRVKGSVSIFNADVMREAVVAGVGIAKANRWLFRNDLKARLVTPILEAYVSGEAPVYALYQDARYLPPRVRALLDFLSEITRQE